MFSGTAGLGASWESLGPERRRTALRHTLVAITILAAMAAPAATASAIATIPTVILRGLPHPLVTEAWTNGMSLAFDGRTLWTSIYPLDSPEEYRYQLFQLDSRGNVLWVLDIGEIVGALTFSPRTGHFYGGNRNHFASSKFGLVLDINPEAGDASSMFAFARPGRRARPSPILSLRREL
jgi:hypothetical protein